MHAYYFISTFYKFITISDPIQTKAFLEELAVKTQTIGLIIIGHEGFNATIASSTKAGLAEFKKVLLEKFNINELMFKDSETEKAPFRRFKVKIRAEIVTLGTPELKPTLSEKNHHLSPQEWNDVLKTEKDYVMIDTRNWYETKIGTFKGAVNPKTDQFTEFPNFMEKNNFEKDKKVLIFCTGGIRCEKGILELQRQGYDQVYQLEGGILNYLKEFPNDQFEGDCFVFDHRVAVDQNMKATKKYKLCPHCGQPGNTPIDCKRCDTAILICEDCSAIEWKQVTCSKNCAHHFQLHPDRKGERQIQPFEIKD
ncbi:MAG: rhodanese-like domain-containing protein [Pseudobdellovibrio sp.]